jgi:hypothetical protein
LDPVEEGNLCKNIKKTYTMVVCDAVDCHEMAQVKLHGEIVAAPCDNIKGRMVLKNRLKGDEKRILYAKNCGNNLYFFDIL